MEWSVCYLRLRVARALENSTTHYTIRASFLTAMEHWLRGEAEAKQNDLRNALRRYIKGIDMNCKDDGLNLNLYSKRTDLHCFPGEFNVVKFTNF